MSPSCLTSLIDRYLLQLMFTLCHFQAHSLMFLFVAQVNQKLLDASKAMWRTLKFPDVWRPCVYMYLSLALSINIHEGLFYWYTDSKDGPSFSQVYMVMHSFSPTVKRFEN